MIRRVLLLNADVGMVDVAIAADPLSPDGLVVSSEGAVGVCGRLGAGFHVPAGQHLGIGAMAAIDGYWWLFTHPKSRGVVSLFLEWDEGRR